ncbi:hypothetical protein DFH27DRAFT_655182 [Peziza echinospora]|nr:hypothetical protein DFH27DRAFT_655182 [Peziza echinospora]
MSYPSSSDESPPSRPPMHYQSRHPPSLRALVAQGQTYTLLPALVEPLLANLTQLTIYQKMHYDHLKNYPEPIDLPPPPEPAKEPINVDESVQQLQKAKDTAEAVVVDSRVQRFDAVLDLYKTEEYAKAGRGETKSEDEGADASPSSSSSSSPGPDQSVNPNAIPIPLPPRKPRLDDDLFTLPPPPPRVIHGGSTSTATPPHTPPQGRDEYQRVIDASFEYDRDFCQRYFPELGGLLNLDVDGSSSRVETSPIFFMDEDEEGFEKKKDGKKVAIAQGNEKKTEESAKVVEEKTLEVEEEDEDATTPRPFNSSQDADTSMEIEQDEENGKKKNRGDGPITGSHWSDDESEKSGSSHEKSSSPGISLASVKARASGPPNSSVLKAETPIPVPPHLNEKHIYLQVMFDESTLSHHMPLQHLSTYAAITTLLSRELPTESNIENLLRHLNEPQYRTVFLDEYKKTANLGVLINSMAKKVYSLSQELLGAKFEATALLQQSKSHLQNYQGIDIGALLEIRRATKEQERSNNGDNTSEGLPEKRKKPLKVKGQNIHHARFLIHHAIRTAIDCLRDLRLADDEHIDSSPSSIIDQAGRQYEKTCANIDKLAEAVEILNDYRPLTDHLPARWFMPFLSEFTVYTRGQCFTQVDRFLAGFLANKQMIHNAIREKHEIECMKEIPLSEAFLDNLEMQGVGKSTTWGEYQGTPLRMQTPPPFEIMAPRVRLRGDDVHDATERESSGPVEGKRNARSSIFRKLSETFDKSARSVSGTTSPEKTSSPGPVPQPLSPMAQLTRKTSFFSVNDSHKGKEKEGEGLKPEQSTLGQQLKRQLSFLSTKSTSERERTSSSSDSREKFNLLDRQPSQKSSVRSRDSSGSKISLPSHNLVYNPSGNGSTGRISVNRWSRSTASTTFERNYEPSVAASSSLFSPLGYSRTVRSSLNAAPRPMRIWPVAAPAVTARGRTQPDGIGGMEYIAVRKGSRKLTIPDDDFSLAEIYEFYERALKEEASIVGVYGSLTATNNGETLPQYNVYSPSFLVPNPKNAAPEQRVKERRLERNLYILRRLQRFDGPPAVLDISFAESDSLFDTTTPLSRKSTYSSNGSGSSRTASTLVSSSGSFQSSNNSEGKLLSIEEDSPPPSPPPSLSPPNSLDSGMIKELWIKRIAYKAALCTLAEIKVEIRCAFEGELIVEKAALSQYMDEECPEQERLQKFFESRHFKDREGDWASLQPEHGIFENEIEDEEVDYFSRPSSTLA